MRAKDLAAFITKREAARLGKGRDPIIAKYRFCNMVRADDRVTQFIFKWAAPWAGTEHLWFAFVVARLLNQPESLTAISDCVLPFYPGRMRAILHGRRDAGLKNFNAAYIVSTNGISMDKVDYIIDRILTPLWKARKSVKPKLLTAGNQNAKDKRTKYEPLASWHQRLQTFQGMGSFMAAQVVADLKYFPPFYDGNIGIPTDAAEDWWTFAASGPGSRRGLNRVMGNPVDGSWPEGIWRATLSALVHKVRPLLAPGIGTRMSAQDYQNSLCEFDKYERARLGEGEPKQLYRPFEE